MATFIPTNSKTKVIIRKQGYPTRCKTFLKKSDGIICVMRQLCGYLNLVSM